MRLLPLVARTARAQWAALLALGLLVLGTSVLAAVGPAALAAGYDRAARQAVGAAPPGAADMVVSSSADVMDQADAERRAHTPPGNAAGVAALGRHWQDAMPAPLRHTIVASDGFAGTGVFLVGTDARGETLGLAIGMSTTAGSNIRYVAGRPPGPPEAAGGAPRFEVALSARAAGRMGLHAGDILPLPARPGVSVRITGLFTTAATASPYWPGRHRYEDAETRQTPDGRVIVMATGLLDPGVYQTLGVRTRLPLVLFWTYTPDPARFTAGSAPALSAAVRQTAASVTNTMVGGHIATFETRLDDLLGDFTARLRTTRALVALALSGLFAAALGALALTGRLLPMRARTALVTQAARGASRTQVGVLTAAVAALVTVPATAAGLACSVTFAPGPLGPVSYAAVAAVAATAVVLPALLAVRAADGAAGRGGRWRLAAEAAVVLAAAGAALLLRRRGLQAGAGGTDPLMSAVPALLAVAAGLLTLRVLPFLVRPACRALARGRSAVAFVGLAGAARRRAGETLPLVVLLLAVAVIGFTTTTGAGLTRAQRLAAWESVGGDARVDVPVLDPATIARLRRVSGVRAVVPAETIDGAHLTSRGDAAGTVVTLVAVDLRAYRRLVAGTPLRLPAPPAAAGSAVPALLSPAAARAAPGGGLTLATDSGLTLALRGAGTVPRFPGQPDGASFVVVPYDPVFRSTGGQVPGSLFVRGDRVDAGALSRAGVDPVFGATTVAAVATYQAAHTAFSGELGRVLSAGFDAAGPLAAGFGALAIVAFLLGAGRERAATLAYLGALGLGGRQARRLAVTEVAPALVAAAAVGWALGLALPAIVGPALDLRPYTGGFAVGYGPAATAFELVGGLVAFAALAALADAMAGARRRPAAILRLEGT